MKAKPSGMCPGCNSDLEIHVFPALLALPTAVAAADLAIAEGEASCYNHPAKRAVVACEQCGRFLCALCQVDLDGRVWCPSCLENGVANRKLSAMENHRTLYDSIALATAAIPAVMISPAVISAPVAIFVALRYWKRPSSIIPRNKWRFVLAIVLALLELGLIVTLIVAGIYAARTQAGKAD
jgi:hypothetical protein